MAQHYFARHVPFLALAVLMLGGADDGPQAVTATVPAGPAHDAVLKTFLKPYATATGTDLGSTGKPDLALVDGPTLTAGCRAQSFTKLDWAALGRDRFLPLAASDCGAGAYLAATVLAWDRPKLQTTPSWSDFWDVAKYPGRRGLRKAARGTLEIALIADGVAPGDVYRTLRSSDGVDRAFRKLDQLKPYIEWWDQPSQPAQYLAAGKVLLTAAPAATLPTGAKSHVGLQWTGSLQESVSWAVPQGAEHAGAALAAIGVATDAARQADFAKATGFGPSTRAAFALLPLPARAENPALPAHLQAGLAIDENFWADTHDKLEARFAAWAAK